MKQTRTAALSRHTAPTFVLQYGLELIQLRRLNDFAFRLFIEVVALANFVSGRVETSHAVLIALLDYDHSPCAHEAPRPTKKRVQKALAELAALRLILDFDTEHNERARGLFFRVPSRKRISASSDMRAPMKAPSKKAAEPALARPRAQRSHDEGTDEGTGVQEKRFNPLTPSLSTATAPPVDVRKLAENTKAAISKKRSEARGASTDRAPRSGSTR